ncbi:hypothetical protein ML462_01090 [Gramella lutea]|uniref:Protein BatD n=1 Tax=Christiangramia lutea TaxID=1607951 RepID=A0A9X2A7S8_9FLAO|nr:hypothetical protein [Christiangramia lutea]MCH4821754.1 hypothetical protein [Christiangramia lutea]
MKSKIKVHTSLLFFLLILTGSQDLFSQNVWANVSLNKNSAYVGEPVEVSIKVFTSTFFTKGIDPGNIQVDGAYTIYFRPVSISIQQNGKTYAGVELKYNVFPYSENSIVFPELNIEVETPPEGDFKGVKKVINTAEKPIRVKPVPNNFEGNEWLVASDLRVSQNWTGDLKNVKVGDVLTRSIGRTAYGTVSELIPPISWDSISKVSLYPTRSQLENNRAKTAISARRTERMQYLFEKEGNVVIPEKVFSWYNPFQNRLYKRTLPEIKIEVQPNPELGLLASVKDSLLIQQETLENEVAEKKPYLIFGLSPKQFLLLVIFVIIVGFLLFKAIRWSLIRYKERKKAYLVSELYYFRNFLKSLRSRDSKQKLNDLYRWLDELDLPAPNISSFIREFGTSSMIRNYKDEEDIARIEPAEWKEARKNYLRDINMVDPVNNRHWINP